jgi:hypothetical protein
MTSEEDIMHPGMPRRLAADHIRVLAIARRSRRY